MGGDDSSDDDKAARAAALAELAVGGQPDLGVPWFDPVAKALMESQRQPELPSPPQEHPGEQFEQIDAAEFEDWLRPREAVTLLGLSWEVATRQLIREADSGRLRTSADSVIWHWGEHKGNESYRLVPTWIWGSSPPKMDDDFWDTGYLSALGSTGGRGYSIGNLPSVKLFDVRFDPIRLQRAAPAPYKPQSRPVAPLANPPVIAPMGAGGRPPQPWWDELWVEICRQIHAGDLDTDRQAKIEKAMLDWAVAKGHKLSETAARSRAGKLFNALNK